jgi:PDZ domain-containing protein
VDIDSQNIGGPSAGMMFTLQIMDQLTEEPLTKGYRIAGTGTIDRDGVVGAIGGVHQKVYGAIAAGARAVLVPAANYDDAVAAAGDQIEVVRVETIDDALVFLESL